MERTNAFRTGVAGLPGLKAYLLAAPFLWGMYYPWTAALGVFWLLAWLLLRFRREGSIRIPLTPLLTAAAVVCLGHLLSPLWAVDRTAPLFGLVGALPLPLFLLCLGQLRPEEREGLLPWIPLGGGIMTLLSGALSLIPGLGGSFLVNHRLAGFFQYPNTFALYLLTGLAVLLFSGPLDWKRGLWALLLSLGILLSGSRLTFLGLGAVAVVYALRRAGGKQRWVVLGAAALLAGAAAIYALVTEDRSAVGRFLTVSLSSSTMLGRLLYVRDALPVIASHPLGLGNLGYYYTQGSFQTGLYTLTHIHNDLAQLLLDLGWLPAGLWIWASLRGLRGAASGAARMAALVILVHCLFDFDLQYPAVGCLLCLVLWTEPKRELTLRRGLPLRLGAGLLALFSLWVGGASALYSAGEIRAADGMLPHYTLAKQQLLTQAETPEEMARLSEEILEGNQSVLLAWDAKARAAYANGDFAAVIAAKEEALRLAPLVGEEYLDYFDMLWVGMGLYEQAGDLASRNACAARLLELPARMEAAEAGLSSLGRRIQDQPELSLPTDRVRALESLAELMKNQ